MPQVERIYRYRTARNKATYAGTLYTQADDGSSTYTASFFKQAPKLPYTSNYKKMTKTVSGTVTNYNVYTPEPVLCTLYYPKHVRKRIATLKNWSDAVSTKKIVSGTYDEVADTHFTVDGQNVPTILTAEEYAALTPETLADLARPTAAYANSKVTITVVPVTNATSYTIQIAASGANPEWVDVASGAGTVVGSNVKFEVTAEAGTWIFRVKAASKHYADSNWSTATAAVTVS